MVLAVTWSIPVTIMVCIHSMTQWMITGDVEKSYDISPKYFFFREASTKSEFCNVTVILDDEKYDAPVSHKYFHFSLVFYIFILKRNETFQKAYYKECMKSDNPNVLICPNKGIFVQDKQSKKNTKILR